MTGEGDAGIQNTWGRGGKRGGLADCIVGGYMVTVGCDEKDGHSMQAGLWAWATGDDWGGHCEAGRGHCDHSMNAGLWACDAGDD